MTSRTVDPDRRWMLASHVLFGVTLAIPTGRALLSAAPPGQRVVTLALVLLLVGWYVAIYARPQWHERQGVMTVYAAGTLALFTVLNLRDDTFFLVLYSLLPQYFSALSRTRAIVATVLLVLLPTALGTGIGALWRDPDLLISLAVTLALGLTITAVVEALIRQSERQHATIDELDRARAEIAALLERTQQDLRERSVIARTGEALIAARSAAEVVAALGDRLADHASGVRGAALLEATAGGRHAVVQCAATNTATPRTGARVAVPNLGVGQPVHLCEPDHLAPDGWTSHGIGLVALLPLAVGAGDGGGGGSADRPPVPGTAQTAGAVDVLWLSLANDRPEETTVRDLTTVATLTALALDNVRLAAQAAQRGRTTGVLAERQRLAHEIHDTLAQGFVSIITQLEAAEETLTTDLGATRRRLDRARTTARDSLSEARRTVAALRPGPLERGATLAEAMDDAVEQWRSRTDTPPPVHLLVDGEPVALDEAVAAVLLRVVQEALANIARHAHAMAVTVTLSYLGDLVLLDVHDDGVGFDAHARAHADPGRGGFGLTAMRERVTAIGGDLVVESRSGEGTTVAARVPVRRPEHVVRDAVTADGTAS